MLMKSRDSGRSKAEQLQKGNTRTDCDARSGRLCEQMMEWLNGRRLPDGSILELTRRGKELVTADGIRLAGDNMFTRFTGRIPDITNALEQKPGEDWETFQQGSSAMAGGSVPGSPFPDTATA